MPFPSNFVNIDKYSSMPVTGTIEQAPRDQYIFTDTLSGDVLFRSLCNISWLFGSGITNPSTISINSNMIIMRPNILALDTNVGINNNSPAYDLDVSGDINFTGNIRQNGSIYYPSPFVSNLTYPTKVYYSGGNVGIGTTNPAYPLHIVGTTQTTTLTVSNITTNPSTVNNTMSIGVDSNTTTINLGNPNTTLNIYGVLSFVDTCNLQVNDTLITLNKGNAAGTASGAGFEIEENGVATGYIKTSTDRNSFLFRAPTGSADMVMNLSGNKVNINSNVFMMDTAAKRIGINTATPQYDLDVFGTVNATSILVGGTALQIGFWKSSNSYNYTQSNAVIGTTSNPQNTRLYVLNNAASQAGTGDMTNSTGNILTLYDTVLYPRISHKSADSTISTVFNFESNKHVYWGETTDSSNVSYHFRGRPVVIGYAGTVSTAYKLDVNGDVKAGGVLEVSNRAHFVNNISVATTNTNEAVNLTGNIGMMHSGNYYPSVGASDKWITIGQNTLTVAPLSQQSNYGYTSTWNQYSCFFGLRDYSTYRDAVIAFAGNTTNNLRFQYSNVDIMTLTGAGSIGIGKTNPSYTLDVNGTVNATAVLIGGQPISLGTAGGFSSVAGGITYTSCNVGIGTNNPGSNALRVAGNLQVDSNLILSNGQMTFQGIMITPKVGSAATNVMSVLNPSGYAYSNDIYITANASGNSIISKVGSQEVMRTTAVNTTGYAGIMNSTPSNTLEINATTTGTAGGATGGARVTSVPLVVNHTSLPTSATQLNDPQPVLVMTRAGTANVSSPAEAIFNLSRYEDSSVTSAKSRLDLQLVHSSNNAASVPTIMTMRSDGNVGIGTTNPAYKLDVSGVINTASNLLVSGSIGVGTTNPTYKLDVSSDVRLNQVITYAQAFPFGVSSANRRYGLVAIAGFNSGIIIVRGFATGDDTAAAGQGRSYVDIEVNARNGTIKGLVSNENANANGIVIYRDTSNNFNVYVTGLNYLKTSFLIMNVGNSSSVYTNPSWSSDAVWTTPANNTLWFDSCTQMAPNCVASSFFMNTAATPVVVQTNLTSGSVGIGTTNPSYKLDVAGNARIGSGLYVGNGTGASTLQLEDVANAKWQFDTTGYNLSFRNDSGGWGTRMVITSSGNVGIGTTNPSQKLDLLGGMVNITNSGPEHLRLCSTGGEVYANFSNATGRSLIGVSGGSNSLNTYAVAGDLVIRNDLSNSKVMIGRYTNVDLVVTGGNVGIGTTNPQQKLDVAGVAQVTCQGASGTLRLVPTTNLGEVSIGFGTNSNYSSYWMAGVGPWNPGTSNFSISTSYGSGTIVSTYTATGNVGIGLTNPAYKLDVLSATSTGLRVSACNASGDLTAPNVLQNTASNMPAILSLLAPNVSTVESGGSNGIGLYLGQSLTSGNSSQIIYRYYGNNSASNSLTLGFYGGNGPLTVTNNSNVGIGTLSPQYKLDVSGTSHFNNSVFTDTFVSFSNNMSTNTPQVGYNGGSGDRVIVYGGNSTGHPYSIGMNSYSMWYSVPINAQHAWYINGSAVMSLSNVGTSAMLTTTGDVAAFGSISDRRLKENVVALQLPYCLDKVNQLRPIEYDWNSNVFNGDHTGKHDVGFIAQEVEQVISQAAKDVDFFGETYKTIKYERIIPYLVGAIKELKEINIGLVKRIELLEQICE